MFTKSVAVNHFTM